MMTIADFVSQFYDGGGAGRVPSSFQQRQEALEQFRRPRGAAANMQIDGHDGGHPGQRHARADQITVPWGTTPFFGMITMPSRM